MVGREASPKTWFSTCFVWEQDVEGELSSRSGFLPDSRNLSGTMRQMIPPALSFPQVAQLATAWPLLAGKLDKVGTLAIQLARRREAENRRLAITVYLEGTTEETS